LIIQIGSALLKHRGSIYEQPQYLVASNLFYTDIILRSSLSYEHDLIIKK